MSTWNERMEARGEAFGRRVASKAEERPLLFIPLFLFAFVFSPISTAKNVFGPPWRVIQEYGGVRVVAKTWWRSRG